MPATRKTGPGRKPANISQKKRGAKAPARGTGKQPARGRNAAVKRTAIKKTAPARTQAQKNDTIALVYCCSAALLMIFVVIGWMGWGSAVVSGLVDLLSGLFGSFSILLPVTLFWIGARRYRGEEKQGTRGVNATVPVVTFICILTVAEAFAADGIKAGMQVDQFPNFLKHAFADRTGGGAVGALLGYWGNMITPWLTLLIAIMLLAVMYSYKGYFSFTGVGNAVGAAVGTGAKTIKQKAVAIKKAVEEHEPIYTEDKHAGSRGEPEVPNLDRESDMRVEPLRQTGDMLHIDEAAEPPRRESVYRGEKPKPRRDDDVYSERVRTPVQTETRRPVRQPEPERPVKKREPEPVKPVRKAEPVYEEPVKKPVKPVAPKEDVREPVAVYDEPDAVETEYEMPGEYVPLPSERPIREPQRPKESFFEQETDRGHEVRQNSDQGKKADDLRADVSRGTSIEELDRLNKAIKHEYTLPSFDLLETGGSKAAEDNSLMDKRRGETLVKILGDFNIPVKLVGVSHGPAVTRLEILPEPGIKVSRIVQYSDDIQMGLEVRSVRIEAPIPGRRAVGIEIPNPKREIVNLRDILESAKAKSGKEKLQVALGKDNGGNYILADLAGMPHVLIAGQTGSGKSICINAIIISLLYRYTPDEVRMIMVDPKMVELNVYNSIPHLLVPVVTDPQKAAGALDWAVMEMTKRYKTFKEHGTKNIESYNQHLPEGEKPMPRIVIIVDELADLMMTAKHDVEESINRLAQLARAAGMHLVIATQRPSVNVITGLIKANIPTRIAFTVASGVDSNTILDAYGAEKLLGKGDMLYAEPGSNKAMRLQGAWVSEDEVQAVVDHIAGQETAVFDEEMLDHLENSSLPDADKKDKADREAAEETDSLLLDAVRAVVEANQASISMLQRKLKVGYPRAGKLIDMMEQRGYIARGEGSKARDVLITREQMERLFNGDSEDGSDAV